MEPNEARAVAAADGKDVTPLMASKDNEKVVRVVWTDKGPAEQEFDLTDVNAVREQNPVEIKKLDSK